MNEKGHSINNLV